MVDGMIRLPPQPSTALIHGTAIIPEPEAPPPEASPIYGTLPIERSLPPRQLIHNFDGGDQPSMAWRRNDEQDIEQTIAEARQAYQVGHEIFVSRLRVQSQTRLAWAVPDAAKLIEGVEREGWQLSHMSENLIGGGLPLMTCIFRRR
jgi:hypothetical protein